MVETRRVFGNIAPICPECHADLTFVCSWPSHGAWGYSEIRTYECATHGPIFIGADTPVPVTPRQDNPSNNDGDIRASEVPVPRKPAPALDTAAVALPQPDPESD